MSDFSISDDELEALKLEAAFDPSITNAKLCKQVFDQNSPRIALSMVKLAMDSPNERIRLEASKYVLERVLGPNTGLGDPKDAPWSGLLADSIAQYK